MTPTDKKIEKALSNSDENSGIDQIKSDIAILKKDVEALEIKVADFEKNKDKLDKVESEKLKKEIEEEDKRIESKRQELLTLIKQTKGELDVLKGDIDISAKKSELEGLEKEINALNVKKSTFWEKTKEVGNKVREWGKDQVVNHTGRTALILGSAGLLYLWFRHKKKEKDSEKKEGGKEKNKFWDSGIGKALKWGTGIFGGVMVWKHWDDIKNMFGNWFGNKQPEQGPADGSYDKLPEETKTKYRTLCTDIDMFDNDNSVNFSENTDKDLDIKGSIVFGLDKQSKNLADFGNNDTLNYMSSKTDRDLVDIVLDWGKEKLYTCVGPYLSRLTSFASFLPDFATDPLKAIQEWLKGGADREKQLSLYFREYINILNYTSEKKILLLQRIASKELGFVGELTDNQKDAVQKLTENEDRCRKNLQKYCLTDLPSLLKEYSVEASAISDETQEIKKSVKEEKDDLLDVDKGTGENVFLKAETDLLDGTLGEISQDKLLDVCDGLEDGLLGGEHKTSLLQAYTHLITDIFAGNTEVADQLKEKLGLEKLSQEIHLLLVTYREKIKNNTFNQQDLTELKLKTDEYFSLKEHYEVSLSTIQKGSSFNRSKDWLKLVNLPWNGIKDIGKSFGIGKTDSWRERIGCGLGGFYMTGQTLYIVGKIKGSRSFSGALLQDLGKGAIKIGELPITLTKKAINLSTDRTFLTGYGWKDYILHSNFNQIEQERLLQYSFLRGEISDKQAIYIAQKMGIKGSSFGHVDTIEKLLSQCGITNPADQRLYLKYRENNALKKLLFKKENFDAHGWKKKIDYKIFHRPAGKVLEPINDAFKELQNIDEFLGKATHQGKKALIEGFLETTKSLKPELVKEIFDTQTFDKLSIEASRDIGKLLGKHIHKFGSLQDFKDFQGFLARHYSSHPSATFVENSLSKWKELKLLGKDAGKESEYIAAKSLESSFLQKRISRMKDNFKKSAETLKKLRGKSPYPEQLNQSIQGLEELSQIDNETYKAMESMNRLGKPEWIASMSKNKQLIDELKPLFANEKFVAALSKANNGESVKQVFSQFGKELPKDVPEEFIKTLAETKNTKNIFNTMQYIEKYESLNKVMKILQHPTMKYAGRIVGKTLIIGTVVLGGIFAYQTYKEGVALSQTNLERGQIKKQESLTDVALTLAGACAFIPGIGWIASGVIIGATMIGEYVKSSVFDTLDKYTKNYKDFLSQSSLLIKQHILSTILGEHKEDAAMSEYLARWFSVKDFAHLTKKTGSEAMKALLYVEERKRNPYAGIDITNNELMDKLAQETPPITRTKVAEAIDEVEKRVVKRYDFLKQKLGTYKGGKDKEIMRMPVIGTITPIPMKVEFEDKREYLDIQKYLSLDNIKNQKGIECIDQLLLASQYQVDNPDFLGDVSLDQKILSLKEELDSDKGKFELLEKLFTTDKRTLAYMYRHSPDLERHINEISFDEQGNTVEKDYETILANKKYLHTYMTYKSLITGIDFSILVTEKTDPADLISVKNFLVDFSAVKPLSSEELYPTSSKLQNILYRIAVEVIGDRTAKNSMDDLQRVFGENNEKMYGLYFENKKLNINGDIIDNAYSGDDIETIKKIKINIQKEIDNNDLIDVGTGDRILNGEIGKRYIKIFDEELAR